MSTSRAYAATLRRELRLYPIYFLLWTIVGLFFFSQAITQKVVSNEPTPWWHYLVSWLVGVYIWALLTPAILWLGRRLPIDRRHWLRRIPVHLLLSLCVSLIALAWESAILSRLGVFPSIMKGFASTLTFLLIIGFHQGVVTYWILLGIQHAIGYYRAYQEREKRALRLELRAAELKTQLMRAELSALKMQLQPHFLFNTLNAIMVLVRQQKAGQAEEMLARLSDLLRCVLEDVDAQEVPLRRELEFLRLYLSIQQVRFPDRLRVDLSADPALLDAAVPHMALQPIVENAIRHGMGRSSAAGMIQISASRRDATLEVRVQDDGPGFPDPNSAEGSGIGLANTRARLEQLYGAAAKLTVENCEHGGALVTMSLPYHVVSGIGENEVRELHAFNRVDR
jgi:two-component system, LytTR family, sensor kinase